MTEEISWKSRNFSPIADEDDRSEWNITVIILFREAAIIVRGYDCRSRHCRHGQR